MSLHPEALTWTALLGQWMHFAQAALALPPDAEGERWRKSITPIINLQAVTFALGDLPRLPRDEWPLAFDKAEMIIAEHSATLENVWHGQHSPYVDEVISDARTALFAAQQLHKRSSSPPDEDAD